MEKDCGGIYTERRRMMAARFRRDIVFEHRKSIENFEAIDFGDATSIRHAYEGVLAAEGIDSNDHYSS